MHNIQKPNDLTAFKDLCFKLGFVMLIFFISRILCTLIISYIHESMSEIIGGNTVYILHLVLSGAFLYVIPLVSAIAIFKDEHGQDIKAMFARPPRLAKALGNFPAMYGLGQLTNFAYLGIIALISWLRELGMGEETLERSFGTMNSILPPNMLTGVVLFIHMVFAAAIFEELLCRGILLSALKPYGNGFAIIVTAFLFGIMHGNFHQFFYTFILGLVLGYITVQTGSVLAAVILHALFNSISGMLMLFLSTETIQEWLLAPPAEQGAETVATDGAMLIFAGFVIYFVLLISLIVAGIALAVRRLVRIKTYGTAAALKGGDNVVLRLGELSAWRKSLIFLSSVPVILMLLLTVDAFAGGFIANTVYGWFR
jgi:hypothetical protein